MCALFSNVIKGPLSPNNQYAAKRVQYPHSSGLYIHVKLKFVLNYA